jgi:anti-anti-sigma regulatory factor
VDSGGVYFNVLANGHPYTLGTERGKGSHSMAGYHSFELCYLAAVYTNLLIRKEPMDFHFRPKPGGLKDGLLRVQPDILPAGAVRISSVWIDGKEHDDFDAEGMTVRLPNGHGDIRVRVRLSPSSVRFSADLLEVKDDIAHIALIGDLTPHDLRHIEGAIAEAGQSKGLLIDATDLSTISSEGLRYLVFRKQKAGADFSIKIRHANEAVTTAICNAEFDEEISLI